MASIPILDSVLSIGITITVTIAYARHNITLQDAIVGVICAVTLTGVYNSGARVVPTLILIFALLPRVPRRYALLFCLVLMIYVPLSWYNEADIHFGNLLAFWFPVAYTLWVVFYLSR